MELLIQVGIVVALLLVGICAGRFNERKHLRRLESAEESLSHIRVDNRKRIDDSDSIQRASLVVGQVVIATDYFKSFAATLRNLVGGEMKSFQSLMMRARREALLRLLQEAQAMGANEVWNIRFEFSNINQMKRKAGAAQVEMLAYGTAVVRRG